MRLSRAWVPVAAVGVALFGSARYLIRVVHVAQSEATSFQPRRGPIALPDSLAGLPGRRDAVLRACDAIDVRGWYFPSRNSAAVVLAHGSGADRTQLAPEARALVEEGFGVLAIDLPGHGESDGGVTFGRCEIAALQRAADFLSSMPEVDSRRIGGMGVSIGSSLLAVAAARDPRFRSVVLVAPFGDSEEQTRLEYASAGALGQWAALLVDRYYMRDGPLRPVDAVRGFGGRALLVVAAADDAVVPLALSKEVYDAADAKKSLFVLPSGGHANIDLLVTGECGRRIADFFRETLVEDAKAAR
jgi:uncharacterized protein